MGKEKRRRFPKPVRLLAWDGRRSDRQLIKSLERIGTEATGTQLVSGTSQTAALIIEFRRPSLMSASKNPPPSSALVTAASGARRQGPEDRLSVPSGESCDRVFAE